MKNYKLLVKRDGKIIYTHNECPENRVPGITSSVIKLCSKVDHFYEKAIQINIQIKRV